jgi:hypothetical protein
VDNSASSYRWATPAALVALGWLAAAAALVWCLAGTLDPAGRVFTGVTTLVLALGALAGSRARPRLAATSVGIEVGGVTGRRVYDWARVIEIRVVHTPRLGRKVATLEIEVRDTEADTGQRLHIFGQLDLGADPREVATALRTLR